MGRLSGETSHNLIYPLQYDWDYGWRAMLHEHRLTNCYLPTEIYDEMINELGFEPVRGPQTLAIIAAVHLLEAIEYPIRPQQTAEALAVHFEGNSEFELPIAEHLRSQMPYLAEARYERFLKTVNESDCSRARAYPAQAFCLSRREK